MRKLYYSNSSNTVFSTNGATKFKEKNIKSMMEDYNDSNSLLQNKKITRKDVVDALARTNMKELRRISNNFYSNIPMFTNFVEYYSNLNCYYWMITPNMSYKLLIDENKEKLDDDKLKQGWYKAIDYVENINPESVGPTITRKVLLDGACYIAIKEKVTLNSPTSFGIQYLPIEYCRSTKRVGDRDVVDFNVKYFDDKFTNEEKRLQVLEMYPKAIKLAYFEWKALTKRPQGSEWRTIDPEQAFKFSIRPDNMPYFIGLILDILDLQDTKDISMFKLEQELSKLIVQKFPVDKDTRQPVIDFEDLKSYHFDLIEMIKNVPGLEAMTTIADIDSIDLQGQVEGVNNNPVKRSVEVVHTGAGVSEQLFNATTSGTLKASITVHESNIKVMIRQMETFLNVLVRKNFKKGEYKLVDYKVSVPEITQMNKIEMSKLYKEHMSLGYSKFLPAIALGTRQSDLISSLIFENDVLNMVTLMRPPASSNTTSGKDISQEANQGEEIVNGRPKLAPEEATEKTEQNKQSE